MAVDILESVLSDETVSTVARRTGMKEKEVEDILKKLRMDYCTAVSYTHQMCIRDSFFS